MTDDLISRRAAIDALWEALYEYEDKTKKQFQESDELDVEDWILHRVFVQNMSDIDRRTILDLPSAQPEDKCSECDVWNKYKNYPQLRWIPVSEKPIPKGLILVTYNDGGIDLLNQPTSYRQGDIVAWMPLPEPYKEKRR